MTFFPSLTAGDILYSRLDDTTLREVSRAVSSLYRGTFSHPSISLYQLKVQIGA